MEAIQVYRGVSVVAIPLVVAVMSIFALVFAVFDFTSIATNFENGVPVVDAGATASLKAVGMFRLTFFRFPLIAIFLALVLTDVDYHVTALGAVTPWTDLMFVVTVLFMLLEFVVMIPMFIRYAAETEKVSVLDVLESLDGVNDALVTGPMRVSAAHRRHVV